MAATRGWQAALLRSLGAPPTRANLRFLDAWQRAEGGSARNNPLNTTQGFRGSSNYNSVGVKNYPSFGAGIQATRDTLNNGRYKQIVSLLRSGRANPSQLGTAVSQSPWGTGGGVLRALGSAPSSLPATTTPSGGSSMPSVGNTDQSGAIVNWLLARAATRGTNKEAPSLLSMLNSVGNTNQSTAGVVGSPRERLSPNSTSGLVSLSPGADRAGVHTGTGILQFAAAVAQQYGQHLTIGTGTNHNKMTVNGNVSQHWSGDAVDIPATGNELIRMGQAALIAAGMNPRVARQQRGGLYNVKGRQIIFNTHIGGNHTNHLHLGR